MNELQRRQLAEEGFCIVPGALSIEDLARVRDALDRGVELTRRMLGTTHIAGLDPNEASIRVNNLPAIDPIFIELLRRKDALDAVEVVLGPHFLVSNFTANIALPGAGPMNIHSDQALVVPPPWLQPWATNVIWCLDDIHAANGATRYLPGSHKIQTFEEAPKDAADRMRPFEAPAGSFIVMDGRLWHTSGANVTPAERRRMMFAYYSSDFVRQQMNWPLLLPPEVQMGMDAETRQLFGISELGNARLGSQIVMRS